MGSTTSITTSRFGSAVLAWRQDESGVTAIEYGLLAALIVVTAMVSFGVFGTALSDLFVYWSEKVSEALGQVP